MIKNLSLTTLQLNNRKQFTRLEPKNKTHSIEEGIQARLKDPLSMLGMQWQMREYRAQNGGNPVRVEIDIKNRALNNIVRTKKDSANSKENFDLKIPLEMKVEEEHTNPVHRFSANGWDSKRLEYSFRITKDGTELIADEYHGDDLDWYYFDLSSTGVINDSTESITVKPVPASFSGMPLARFWSIEDRRVDLGQINRPQLNFLTMMLVEFSLIYSNDWFVIPVEHKVGNIRQIETFVVMDSFGVTSKVKPVIDSSPDKSGWEVFTLSPISDNGKTDGRIFYMPNNLYHALESEPIEKVNFFRDELANLVWAIEQRYENQDRIVVNRNDEEAEQTLDQQPKPSLYWDTQSGKLIDWSEIVDKEELGRRFVGPVALYDPMTKLPAHWIPYRPRQLNTEGGFILRRARTIEDLSGDSQYKGIILGESKYIYEDEIPRTGIMVSRVFQLARGCDGERYCWRSRKKKPDELRNSSGLRFDSVIEK